MSEKDEKRIELPASISIRDMAEQIQISPLDVMKKLMASGVMANINQEIDFDTAAIVVAEFGFEAVLEELHAEILVALLKIEYHQHVEVEEVRHGVLRLKQK